MIPPAPNDFWEQIEKYIAKLVYDREMTVVAVGDKNRFVEKLPHLASTKPPDNAA